VSVAGHSPRGGEGVDNFPTPSWCIDRLLEAWTPRAGWIMEPAAGDGAIIAAARRRLPLQGWAALDIRDCGAEQRAAGATNVYTADFLRWDGDQDITSRITTVWTNPPFALAEQFIRRADSLFPDADLCFLVRLGFLATEKRSKLWWDLGAPDVYVLPNRPSFTPDGGTDSSDYAWIVLPGDEARAEGKFCVLATTPKEQRR
jgi:hypothetical protein